jgi:hypothetical protein
VLPVIGGHLHVHQFAQVVVTDFVRGEGDLNLDLLTLDEIVLQLEQGDGAHPPPSRTFRVEVCMGPEDPVQVQYLLPVTVHLGGDLGHLETVDGWHGIPR